jgi:signal-transduction protein with cAMP-binding, CBS, and nucleotidyltransferase domain
MALVVWDTRGSTVDRVRRGFPGRNPHDGSAEDLVDDFEQIFQLPFDQEIAALKSGVAGENHVMLSSLDSLQRNYLRDSLRAIAKIQTAVRKAWASGEVMRLQLP